jgi:hypothetical protein
MCTYSKIAVAGEFRFVRWGCTCNLVVVRSKETAQRFRILEVRLGSVSALGGGTWEDTDGAFSLSSAWL